MITDHPAAVTTSANVDPPGPEPTMTTSQSRSAIAVSRDRCAFALADLDVGVTAGLDVAVPADHLPAHFVDVAAVHGAAVHALARVLVEHSFERRHCLQPRVPLVGVDRCE